MTDQPKPAPALTVQFFLKHGTIVSWPVPTPQDFSFSALVTNVRATGCFMMPDCYVPTEEIACIGLIGTGSPPSVRVRQPVPPAHPTKQ